MITTAAWRARLAWAAAFLPLWATLAGRSFGDDNMMGMQIDSVQVQAQTTTVTTTGTEFVLDPAQNQILCYQRIPEWRQVATISGLSLSGLTLQSQNAQQCVLNTQQGSFTIGANGLMTMTMGPAANIGITGSYQPAYQGKEYNGADCKDLYLPDATGGMAVYNGGGVDLNPPTAWNSGWTVNCQRTPTQYCGCRSFRPGRSMCNKRTRRWCNRFPTMNLIRRTRRYRPGARLARFWPCPSTSGKGTWEARTGMWNDQAYATSTFTPKNDAELRRVIATAHSLGMKVIPYTSPLYYNNPNGNVNNNSTMSAYLGKIQSVLSDYGFDGVYADGLYQGDVADSLTVVQGLRQIVGNSGILYLHETNLPFASMPCPAIDAYANYTLRGEHMQLTDDYARWQVSDYNLGNAVGMFCYDTDRPDSAMINTLLADNARLPYFVQDSPFPPDYTEYTLSPAEVSLLNAEYFPRLAAPEPSAVALLGTGLFGVLAYVWRRDEGDLEI